MQSHIFLTGDIQVGKSTIIRKVIHELGISPGGFRTSWGDLLPDGSADLFLLGMDEVSSSDRIAARRFGSGRGITAFPEIFDKVGSRLIAEASSSPLIIMDELGFIEKDAATFRHAVLSSLNGSVPILGVVRNMQTPFLDSVRSHPNVKVIIVTKENREELFEQVLEVCKKSYSR